MRALIILIAMILVGACTFSTDEYNAPKDIIDQVNHIVTRGSYE